MPGSGGYADAEGVLQQAAVGFKQDVVAGVARIGVLHEIGQVRIAPDIERADAGVVALELPKIGERAEVQVFFLFSLRMVASGWEACRRKAEGLMPTMFLNCLEK